MSKDSIAKEVQCAFRLSSHLKLFSRLVENANFPHFRLDHSANIGYLKVKRFGHVVTVLLCARKNYQLLKFVKNRIEQCCADNIVQCCQQY